VRRVTIEANNRTAASQPIEPMTLGNTRAQTASHSSASSVDRTHRFFGFRLENFLNSKA
jgi:hypothetical protein